MALHLLGPGCVVFFAFEERDCFEGGFGRVGRCHFDDAVVFELQQLRRGVQSPELTKLCRIFGYKGIYERLMRAPGS